MDDQNKRINRLTNVLNGELFKALGFYTDGLLAKVLSPLVHKPIRKFAEMCVNFDQIVIHSGFQVASRWFMSNFISDMQVEYQQEIPTKGPLLICSNHPGAYDTLVITSNLPRDDIKIIVNIPLNFIKEIPATLSHFLYAPNDPFVRMNVIRNAIKHLRSGGALLVFASGRIDPDPETMEGSEMEIHRWSRSLELMLQRVPETNLIISIVSNILHQRFINHVFTSFQKERPDKQRISEFLQVMNQMKSPEIIDLIPRISFSRSYTIDYLRRSEYNYEVMSAIREEGKRLLELHLI